MKKFSLHRKLSDFKISAVINRNFYTILASGILLFLAVWSGTVSGQSAQELDFLKTINTAEACNEFDIRFDISGTPGARAVEVILVIDRSGSMRDSDPASKDPLDFAKEAALEFAHKVLIDNYILGNKVGIVSYSYSATVDQPLTDDYSLIESAVNSIVADGYTNIADGFLKAKGELAENGLEKCKPISNIILLTDGVANRAPAMTGTCTGNAVSVISASGVVNSSYALGVPNGAGAELWDWNDRLVLDLTGGNTLLSGGSVNVTWRRAAGTASNPSVLVEVSDNNSTWTTVSTYTITSLSFVSQNIPLPSDARYIRFTETNEYNLDIDGISFETNCTIVCPACETNPITHTCCTNAAIIAGQAAQMSSNGYPVRVFTIGLFHDISGGVETIARSTMQQAQNSGFYETESATDLSFIYTSILNQLVWAAKDMVVEETIPAGFTVVPGTASVNMGSMNIIGNTINWTVAELQEDTARLAYSLRYTGSTYGDIELLSQATISYEDYKCRFIDVVANETFDICVPNVEITSLSVAQETNCECAFNYNATAALTGNCSGSISSYQWTFYYDGINVGSSSQASGKFTLPSGYCPLINNKLFRGVLTVTYTDPTSNNCNLTATGEASVITFYDNIQITNQPDDTQACIGGNVLLSITASGVGSIYYQWQSSDSETGPFVNIEGARTSTYTVPTSASGTKFYRVVVSNGHGDCFNVISNVAEVVVLADPVIVTNLSNVAICAGEPVELSVTVANGSGIYLYQWQSSDSETGPFVNITNATGSSYSPPSATSGTKYYRLLVTDNLEGCNDLISDTAEVVINPVPEITQQPLSANVCAGASLELSVNVTGGSGTYTYQWQSAVSVSGPFSDILSATANTFAVPTNTESTIYYRVIITDDLEGCNTVTSNIATIRVYADPVITSQPTGEEVCVGGTALLSVTVSGGAGSFAYQWKVSDSENGTYSDITGANGDSYNAPTSASGTNYYKVAVSNSGTGCDNVLSNPAEVIVNPDPSITSQPQNAEVCIGGSVTLSVTATGGSGSYSYQWKSSATSGGTYSNISGANGSTYAAPATTAGTLYYKVDVSDTMNGCNTITSNATQVIVNPDPTITTHPQSNDVCIGSLVTLSVTPTGGSGSYAYQWQMSDSAAGTYANIGGATSQTYSPSTNNPGEKFYKVTVTDNMNGCNTITSNYASVTVNYYPVAENDINSTFLNTGVSGNVLTNDHDAEGDALAVNTTPVTNPAHGTVLLNSNGTYTYTPSNGYTGADFFRYKVCDICGCDTAVVSIEVIGDPDGTNRPPVAADDYYSGKINTPVSGKIIANDFDPDGNNISVNTTPVTPPAQGTLTINPDGTFTYTPVTGFTGVASFVYEICDDGVPTLCDQATVTIDIFNTPAGENSTVAVDDLYKVKKAVTTTGDVSLNDYDPEGNTQTTFTLTSNTSHGTLVFNSDGSFTYTSDSDFKGTDWFIYSVCDNGSPVACDVATAYIIVESQYPPVANNDLGSDLEEDGANGTINILSNDTDPDGNPAAPVNGVGQFTLDLDPATPGIQTSFTNATGVWTLNISTGVVTFNPADNYNGTATIQYTLCDPTALCDDATITFTVTPVNDPPVANNDLGLDLEEDGANGTINILSNDTDLDGNPTAPVNGVGQFTIDLDPATPGIQTSFTNATGVWTLNISTGVVTFDPADNYNGTATIQYTLCDPTALCDDATITFAVTPVNDPPVANNDLGSDLEEDGANGTINILSNDTDPDGNPTAPVNGAGQFTIDLDPATPGIQASFTNATGVWTLNTSTGVVNFDPANNYNGTATIQYTLCDPTALCDDATITFAVTPVNDPPVANNDLGSDLEEDGANGTINILSNDTDPDGNPTAPVNGAGQFTIDLDPATPGIQASFTNATGVWTLNTSTGVVTFDPANNYNGTATIQYTLCDPTALCDDAAITFNVGSVCDEPVVHNAILYECDQPGSVVAYESFNLNDAIDEITGGQSGVTVTFYLSYNDAENKVNQISSPHTNDASWWSIVYARVEDDLEGCFSIATVDLYVLKYPEALNTSIVVCDMDKDGFESFDLTGAEAVITNGQENVTLAFFATQNDALNNQNPLPGSYINTSTVPQVVFARVTFDSTLCYNIAEVTLDFYPEFTITGQPQSAEVCTGGNLTLSVTPNGGSGTYSYQWMVSDNNNGPFSAIDNAYDSIYVVPTSVSSVKYYKVVVSDAGEGCTDVTSAVATITINEDPSITAQPEDVNTCVGSAAILNVAASDNGGIFQYQWSVSETETGEFIDIPGATSDSYNPPTDTASVKYYRVVVTSEVDGCNSIVSDTVMVRVFEIYGGATYINTPTPWYICYGGRIPFISHFQPAQPEGELDFQWQISYDGENFSDIPGANSMTYLHETPITDTIWIRRKAISIYNSNCFAFGYPKQIIPVDPPDPGEIGIDQTIYSGEIPLAITSIRDGESSSNLEIGYYWYYRTTSLGDNFDGVPWTSTKDYQPGILTDTTWFKRQTYISGVGNCITESNIIQINVNESIEGGEISGAQSICVGGDPDELSSVSPATGTGTLSYQWQISSNGIDFSDIPGATGLSYNPDILITDSWYRRVAKRGNTQGGDCNTAFSNVIKIEVNEDPSITTQPQDAEVCIGSNVTLSVTATGGSGNYSYQWKSATSENGVYANIGGATASTYNVPTTVAGTVYYKVTITDAMNGCNEITSNAASVIVNEDPSIIDQPQNDEVCTGGSVTLSVTATGGSGNYSYQWKSSDSENGVYTNIDGATASTYNAPTSAAGTTFYKVTISDAMNGCNDVTSTAALVVVYSQPTISEQPVSHELCLNGNAPLSVEVTGGSGSYSYQWYVTQTWGGEYTAIAGATNQTFDAPTNVAATVKYYRVVVTDNVAGCDELTSEPAEVRVHPDPSVTSQPEDQEVCLGAQATLSVMVGGGVVNFSYQWQVSDTKFGTYTNVPGATTISMNPPTDVVGTKYYRLLVYRNASGCDDTYSNPAMVKVNPDPSISAQPSDAEVCIGGTAALTVVVTGGSGNYSYQWETSTSENGVYENIMGANTSTYNAPTSTTGTKFYKVSVTDAMNGCNEVTSEAASVKVNEDPSIVTQPQSTVVCINTPVTLSVAATGGSGIYSYQWVSSITENGVYENISGANTSSYEVPTSVAGKIYYKAIVSDAMNGCNTIASIVSSVTVLPEPRIFVQPQDVEACLGDVAFMEVAADGGSESFVWQWYESGTPDGVFTEVTGATSYKYILPTGSVTEKYYKVVVKNSDNDCSVESEVAKLTVYPLPEVTHAALEECDASADRSGFAGFTLTDANPTVLGNQPASGFSVSYYLSFEDAASVSNALSSPFTNLYPWWSVIYSRVENNTTGCYSIGTVDLAVNRLPISNPASLFVCDMDGNGYSAFDLNNATSTVKGLADDVTVSYYETAVNAENSQNPLMSPYTNTATVPQVIYARVENNLTGCYSVSCVTLDFYLTPEITTQPENRDVCVGTSTILSVAATGGSGDYQYQWYISDSENGTFEEINGAADSTYTPATNITGIKYYKVSVFDQGYGCSPVFSDVARVRVIETSGGEISGDQSVCAGQIPAVFQNVSDATPAGEITYQWFGSRDGFTFTLIEGATGSSYQSEALTDTTWFKRVALSIYNDDCLSESNTIRVNIYSDIDGGEIEGEQIMCEGGNPDWILGVTKASGNGSFTYQWQMSTNGVNFTNIPGATELGFDPDVLTRSTWYRRLAFREGTDGSGCNTGSSNVVKITVNPDPYLVAQPSDNLACAGALIDLYVEVAGGSGQFAYQWLVSDDEEFGYFEIPGATSGAYRFMVEAPGVKYYKVRISNDGNHCEEIYSNPAMVEVLPEPVISGQPQDADVCLGSALVLGMDIEGGSDDYYFQWMRSSTGNLTSFVDIPGADKSYYNPATNELGTFYYRAVLIDNGDGCNEVFSRVAKVTVNANPVITAQPKDLELCFGSEAQIEVAVRYGSGSYTYQWFVSSESEGDFSAIEGATAKSLNLNTGEPGTRYYYVRVTDNGNGCAEVDSRKAMITVFSDPEITVQPQNGDICLGYSAHLEVTAEGGSGVYTYQWQRSTEPGGPFTNITGATNRIYTAQPSNPGLRYYRVVVKDGLNNCNEIISEAAKVGVYSNPSIVAQPVSKAVCASSAAILNVAVSGGSGNYTYQWMVSDTEAGNYSPVTGATNSSFEAPTQVQGTKYYKVVVSDQISDCNSVTSAPASVTVSGQVVLNKQPNDAVICFGGSALLEVEIAENAGAYQYSWESSDNTGGPFTAIAGATGKTLAVQGNFTGEKYYRVTITGSIGECSTISSRAAKVSVLTAPVITGKSADTEVCLGSTVQLSVTVDADRDDYTIRWSVSNSANGNYEFIQNSGTNPYSFTANSLGIKYYRALVTWKELDCGSESSEPLKVTVYPGLAVSTQITNLDLCPGSEGKIEAIVAGGSGYYTYQWLGAETQAGPFAQIAGETKSSITIKADNLKYRFYKVFVSNAVQGCSDATSQVVSVTITETNGGTISGDQTLCSGSVPAPLRSVTAASPSGKVRYQWQSSTDGISFANIAGATSENYSPVALTASTWFRRIASRLDNNTCYDESNVVKIEINSGIEGGAISGTQVICTGETPSLLANVSAASGVGSFVYQWQSSTDGVVFTYIQGATGLDYQPAAVTSDTWFKRLVSREGTASGSCNAGSSNVVKVDVNETEAGTVSGVQTICLGEIPSAFTSVIDGKAAGVLSYQWLVSTDNIKFDTIPGATSKDYRPGILLTDSWFKRITVSTLNGEVCSSGTSAVKITVLPALIVSAGNDQAVCPGSPIELNETGNEATSWLWTGPAGFSSTQRNPKIQAATSANDGLYIVTGSRNGCSSADTVRITVSQPPVVTIAETNDVVCFGETSGSAMIAISEGIAPYNIIWNTLPAQTGTELKNVPAGVYTATVTDVKGCSAAIEVKIEQADDSLVAAVAKINQPSCDSQDLGSVEVVVSGGVEPYSYQWTKGQAIVGITKNITGLQAGDYLLTVTDANGCSASVEAKISQAAGFTLLVADVTESGCSSDNSGSATVVVSGGTAPFTYLWNDPLAQKTAKATGLSAGTYTVKVTDASGCSATAEVVINQSAGFTTSITNVVQPGCNENTGSATVIANGGVAPFTYLWDDKLSQKTATATGLAAGTYTVVVTDSRNCSATARVVINPSTGFTASITNVVQPGCNENTGSATVVTNGGVAPFTYLWDDKLSQTTATATGLAAGTYTVVVTDSRNCSTSARVVINPSTGFTASITNVVQPGCNENTGSATVVANGGVAPFTYLWDDKLSQKTATATGLTAGTYTVVVTDSKNCSAVATVKIMAADTVPPVAVCNNFTVYLGNNGTAMVTAAEVGLGSSDNCGIDTLYLNQYSFDCSDIGANQVTLTVVDNAGLESMCEATVTVADTIAPDAVCSDLTVYLGQNGMATLTASKVGANSSDNCAIDTLYLSKTSFSCEDLGLQQVILTVADRSGNMSECTATIEVRDTLAPVISCTSNLTVSAVPGQCSANVTLTAPVVTDNCGVKTIVNSFNQTDNASGTYTVGETLVVWTATDNNGNIAKCTVKVTVTGYTLANPDQALVVEFVNIPVLTNDSACPKIDSTKTTVTKNPAFGVATVYKTTGIILYTINPEYAGVTFRDEFIYRISNPEGITDTALVVVFHEGQVAEPLPPVAKNDTFDADCDALNGNVLSNDEYVGDPLTATILTYPEYGQISFNPDGTFTYTADDGFIGQVQFTYRICYNNYGSICSNIATVVINVECMCELFVPNAFSPNNDGVHDVFFIECLEPLYPDAVLEVYNRWGVLVFRQEHYGNETVWTHDNAWWDGRSTHGWTLGNEKVPVGTYPFILMLEPGNVKKGMLYINY